MYEDAALLFFDVLGGNSIGVVWQPSLKNPRPFRVLSGYSSIPVSEKSLLVNDRSLLNRNTQLSKKSKESEGEVVSLNQQALPIELERIGQDLIMRL